MKKQVKSSRLLGLKTMEKEIWEKEVLFDEDEEWDEDDDDLDEEWDEEEGGDDDWDEEWD